MRYCSKKGIFNLESAHTTRLNDPEMTIILEKMMKRTVTCPSGVSKVLFHHYMMGGPAANMPT